MPAKKDRIIGRFTVPVIVRKHVMYEFRITEQDVRDQATIALEDFDLSKEAEKMIARLRAEVTGGGFPAPDALGLFKRLVHEGACPIIHTETHQTSVESFSGGHINWEDE